MFDPSHFFPHSSPDAPCACCGNTPRYQDTAFCEPCLRAGCQHVSGCARKEQEMKMEKAAVEEAQVNRTAILPEGTYDLDTVGDEDGRAPAVRMQAIGAAMWFYKRLMKAEREMR